jgi:hypothetical protein
MVTRWFELNNKDFVHCVSGVCVRERERGWVKGRERERERERDRKRVEFV